MKIYHVIAVVALFLTGCKSGIGSKERLGWYVPFVPKDLDIEKFYETPSPSMDHEYMWMIRIKGNEEYLRFEEQFTKAPPNVDGVNDYDSVAAFDAHPQWWKKIDFSKGTLHKHRVQVVGSGGSEWAYVFAMLDKEAGLLYIQAF
jgi:hypothetical protein